MNHCRRIRAKLAREAGRILSAEGRPVSCQVMRLAEVEAKMMTSAGRYVRLHQTYRSDSAQRFALEPAPYGADWPEVAYEAEVIFVYEKEAREPGAHFYLLLAYDAEKNEVGRKRLQRWMT